MTSSVTGSPAAVERVDDDPGAERGRLDQGPVDVRRPGGQGQPDDQRRTGGGRPARCGCRSASPARSARARRPAGPRPRRTAARARRRARRAARSAYSGGTAWSHEPGEDVADPALPGLVAPQPGDDAAVHHPAHAGHLGQRVAVHHVAGRGAHDGDHLARRDRVRGGRGDVRVHVADRDRDARGQPGPPRPLARSATPARAPSGDDRVGELVRREAGEPRVERGQELRRRVVPVLVDALVPGGAGVPGLGAAQLPDDPVGGLDPAVRAAVDLRVLLQQLQPLGELPLGRDLPAVPADPRLAALVRQRVDPVGLRLGGVVLPQLGVGVRAAGQPGQLAQRRAVRAGRAARCRR